MRISSFAAMAQPEGGILGEGRVVPRRLGGERLPCGRVPSCAACGWRALAPGWSRGSWRCVERRGDRSCRRPRPARLDDRRMAARRDRAWMPCEVGRGSPAAGPRLALRSRSSIRVAGSARSGPARRGGPRARDALDEPALLHPVDEPGRIARARRRAARRAGSSGSRRDAGAAYRMCIWVMLTPAHAAARAGAPESRDRGAEVGDDARPAGRRAGGGSRRALGPGVDSSHHVNISSSSE